ncbi:MAG: helix-turn-helix domain-containing protein [Candidatus Marsarchaeota archaeon]|nr:helix-turn-helix domain-containing protein [Candidatus Marsarchaeota archaeon]MCL5431280.1 helix-turn-helix domain-containing protein [Candidatus Marsarchaeota archaeon]
MPSVLRDRLISSIARALEARGFSHISVGNMHSCFDIIAEKRGSKLLIKAVADIDSISKSDVEDLLKLAGFFNAYAYVVGSRRKGLPFPKGIGFMRYGVTCIGAPDLEAALDGSIINISKKFSGVSIQVSGPELKHLRRLVGLSIRELASTVGISKESIERYESGSGKAHSANLKKLEEFFGGKLSENSAAQQANFRYAATGSIRFLSIRNAPFDAIAKKRFRYEAKEKSASMHTLYKVASFYSKVTEAFDDDHPFFIVSKGSPTGRLKGIPVLTKESLKKMIDEDELLNAVTKN